MRTIFRTIRRKLFKENKVSKYLLYAVGEIILVIIGILIALSINNANEQRKERVQEQKILTGIKNDFLETRERLENTIEAQREVVRYSGALIDIIGTENRSVSHDSIIECLGRGAFSFYRAEPVTGTYDALIGAGNTSIIQNQDILNALANFSAHFKLGFEDETTCTNLVHLMHQSGNGQLFPLMTEFSKGYLKQNYSSTEQEKQIAIDLLLKNKAFASHLNQRTVLEKNRLDRQRGLLSATNIILIPFEFEEIQLSNEALQKFVGDYEMVYNEESIIFKIYFENGYLYAHPTGNKAFQLFPHEEAKFFLKDIYAQIDFHSKDRKITSFTFFQEGKEYDVKKVK